MKKIILLCFLIMPVFAACNNISETSVSVHGVNYSDQEFTYVLQDPLRPSNQAGGETIGRYGAGGTMCCFTLPEKWRPGIKVNIQYTYYLPKKPDGSLPEIRKSTVVELPHYDEPQELWVLRNVDGSMSIVSSMYQPDHPKWPGKIKGWPVPSLEYRRERWGLYMEHQLVFLRSSERLLEELKKYPEIRTSKSWDTEKQINPEVVLKFKGPKDPNYILYLKNSYEESIDEIKKEIKNLNDSKP
ncbi:hypothetical protein CNX70_13885 [Janthinobacterium svalbardensis]|uniref:DUF3304 domain-containing protein n=1 Tax=Janthinobacterium svalbardensis TaxID=368607 RepID=A0A290WW84_9BURK|nr:DUF3304 domain-containing protein [Janthinobacterium svalbardensis]ATD61133.1 hypothetical protein CNX70_13885 [Janthinobacterium svalbardensis]